MLFLWLQNSVDQAVYERISDVPVTKPKTRINKTNAKTFWQYGIKYLVTKALQNLIHINPTFGKKQW